MPRPGSLELDPAAVRRRELPRDREAEACAAAVARPEGTEDPVALVVGFLASVLDRDRDVTVVLVSARSTRPPSGVQRKAFESRLR